MKRIATFVLWGAIGFGVGGAIGGAIWFGFELPQYGFAVMGAIGGASLGLASRSWKMAGLLALAGAIGFGIGLLLGFFIVLAVWGPPVHVERLFRGAVGGVVGGILLGIALRNRLAVVLLALTGALGFGVAMQAHLGWYITQQWLPPQMPYAMEGAVISAMWGIIGGAFLGAALGYLEKRKVS